MCYFLTDTFLEKIVFFKHLLSNTEGVPGLVAKEHNLGKITMSKKIIAVVGATGAQGGALARAILDDPNTGFVVRALVRDPESDKAKQLAARGAEVVMVDIDDVESLEEAFKGAYGAYFVTFFWHHMSGVKEKHQAMNLATAARAVGGLQHVIWSTLEDTRKLLPVGYKIPWLEGGRYVVPHFDAKAEADSYTGGLPVTFLRTSFYWENFSTFFVPQKGYGSNYSLTLPMGEARLAGMAAEDIGKCAYGVFKLGQSCVGKTVGITSEAFTIAEICQKLSNTLGVNVAYNPVEPDTFRKFGFPGADEVGNMFQVYRDFELEIAAGRSWFMARELNPEVMGLDQWLVKNAAKIGVAMGIATSEAAAT